MIEFNIGDKMVGGDSPVFIIAELGTNHDTDLDKAKDLIKKAAGVGADAAKLQTFIAEEHFAKPYDEKEYALLEKLRLPLEWYPELIEYAKKQNIILFSTPFDIKSAKFLKTQNMPVYKIASAEIVNIPLLEEVGSYGKPVILSTGMSTLGEVEEAISALKKKNNLKDISILQCTASYPAPMDSVNLRAMKTLKGAFPGYPIGLSDHTMSGDSAIAAVAMGAKIIEKHLTTDRSLDGPDHPFALEVDEFRSMVDSIRNVEKAMGSPEKIMVKVEEKYGYKSRKTLFANREILKGTVITKDMLSIIRPNLGLLPKFMPFVIGKKVVKDIKKFDPITLDSISE